MLNAFLCVFSDSKQHGKLQKTKKRQNKATALNFQTHYDTENSLSPYLWHFSRSGVDQHTVSVTEKMQWHKPTAHWRSPLLFTNFLQFYKTKVDPAYF